MLGMVWTRFRVCSIGARSLGRRWPRMPSGRPDQRWPPPASPATGGRAGWPRARRSRHATRTRASPKDRSSCPDASSGRHRDGRHDQGRDPGTRPEPQAGERIGDQQRQRPASGARTRRRARPAHTSRLRASARWRLDRRPAPAPTRPATPAASRSKRRPGQEHDGADPRAAGSTARHPSTGGSALSRRCGSPAAIRLALNTSSGASRTAAAPTAQASAPSRSIRRAAPSGAAEPAARPRWPWAG